MTGNITSTNYPRDYFNNLNCEYLIDLRSSGASSVTLTFNDFKTENGFDNVYVNLICMFFFLVKIDLISLENWLIYSKSRFMKG